MKGNTRPKSNDAHYKGKPIVAIVGQTASGKSEVGVTLAQKFNGEIVAADSWTVRQELDIGTAKPTTNEKKAIRHHGLNIVSPCQSFTAVAFQQVAYTAIREIHSRGNIPFIIGGTGLYIDSVLYQFSFARPGSSAQRARYNQMTIAELLTEAKAKMLDTSSIDVRNKRRIIRLLETDGATPGRKTLQDNSLIIGIKLERDELHSRIEQRVETMLDQGLEEEVRMLSKKYGWDCEGLKGIGYIEWKEYFSGLQTREHTKQRIISATKQLAKRQDTWFKRNSDIIWCSDYQQVESYVEQFIKTT